MASSQANFLLNAHHFEVNDSQFINATNGANVTVINNPATSVEPVSTTLCQYVAAGAMFDSAERYSPGRCHPGTRKTAIRQITEWIADPNPIQCILWLYGPAGAGKSALAQSICEFLAQSNPDRYAASFFFSKGSTDRGNALKLISTLSYQLAVRFPCVRSGINKALIRDPMLPNKSMEIQMLSLIVEPILQCKGFPSHRPVIIIDGLDECADDEGASIQRNIISLLANLPLRFMIFSRPEYWIRDAFDIPPLPKITFPLSLKQTSEADADIRTYLTDGFEKICKEHKRVMESVALPWPSTAITNHFVYEASGQFIYASTVLKFVGRFSRFSNPKAQLSIITSPSPHRASAFSELDRLYTAILSAYPRWETMKRVLGGLLNYPYPTIVRVLLDVDPDELVLVLDALSSLLDVTKSDLSKAELTLASAFQVDPGTLIADRSRIQFCHLSFVEFLKDQARSGAFYIDASAYQGEIAHAFFGLIHRNIDQGYQTEPHLVLEIEWSTYIFVMDNVAYPYPDSFWHSEIDRFLPIISQMTKTLVLLDEFYTGKSMNSLLYFMRDMRLFERSLKTMEEKKSQPALERLEDAVLVAQQKVMYAMTFLREFTDKVTPLLISLVESPEARTARGQHFEYQRFVDGSVACSGNGNNPSRFRPGSYQLSFLAPYTPAARQTESDFAEMIEENRHILSLSYFPEYESWSLKIFRIKALLEIWGTVNPRFQNEWKEHRLSFAHCLLNSNFCFRYRFGFQTYPWDMLQREVFNPNGIADICSEENPQITPNLSALLEWVGDLSNWSTLRDFESPNPSQDQRAASQPYLPLRNFIISVICWLNRQLTNLHALKVLQDHNEGLPQRLTSVMNYLFKEIFLQDFNNEFHEKGLHDKSSGRRREYLLLRAAALPQGFDQTFRNGIDLSAKSNALDRQWIISTHWAYYRQDYRFVQQDWPRLHDQIFGKIDRNTEHLVHTSIIAPSCWYHDLASRLLRALVEFIYYQVCPKTWNGGYFFEAVNDSSTMAKFKTSLSYIIQSLPSALPTSDNLNTLRLIVYLYPQAIDAVSPVLPEGIWVLISEFLKKYDRSLLSSEELDLFESWLHSTDHGDIKKYVKS